MTAKSVAKLEGYELDYWVAMATDMDFYEDDDGTIMFINDRHYVSDPDIARCNSYIFEPSVDWGDGGPLIEAYDISLTCKRRDKWTASCHLKYADGSDSGSVLSMTGKTPLLAAMRLIVYGKYGDTVTRSDSTINSHIKH